MAGLTVLDASILLAHLDDTDPHAEAAQAILAGEGEFAASTITLAEVLVGSARAQRLDEQLAALAGLEIREVAIEQGAAAQLARLRAETGLRMPDCACCTQPRRPAPTRWPPAMSGSLALRPLGACRRPDRP